MTRDDSADDQGIQDIVDRLSTQFPHKPAASVVDAVEGARHHFERATVGGFVPVRVEREAKARLERPI